jgi:hypothetical protein
MVIEVIRVVDQLIGDAYVEYSTLRRAKKYEAEPAYLIKISDSCFQ